MSMTDAAERQPEVILCATHRLVRRLRTAGPAGAGGVRAAQPATTITQWLDAACDRALFAGTLPAGEYPPQRLDARQEQALWRRVVGEALAADPLGALLDVAGLAQAAVEANALVEVWGARADATHSEETRQFLAWRAAFRRHCDAGGFIEPARHLARQIDCVARGRCALPAVLAFAGFDRLNPQEARLREALVAAGVVVEDLPLGGAPADERHQARFADAQVELAAAVAWAHAELAARPAARIGIVVPELAARRDTLLRLLDERFAPHALHPASAAAPRPYNLSLGVPLADVPPVSVALSLLQAALPGARLEQPDFGALLNGAYWGANGGGANGGGANGAASGGSGEEGGASEGRGGKTNGDAGNAEEANGASGAVGDDTVGGDESEARARLEARLRERLPYAFTLADAVRRAWAAHYRDGDLPGTAKCLADLARAGDGWRGRRLPGEWAAEFPRALAAAGWPGARPLDSHDFQARAAFDEALAALAGLDGIVGKVGAGEALSLLREACRETIFQPKTEGEPPLQVLGLLEAALEEFDALWVSGLTDALWPPPARANPLLPAVAQRAVAAPNSSPAVQAAFAAAIHTRLLCAAPRLVVSAPLRDGERELAASPLIRALPALPADLHARLANPRPLALALQAAGGDQATRCELIDDHRAPPVPPGEPVAGGTGVLRAQALCPAWAYFQYRLGARALKTPVEGLDPAARGTLAHAVFEAFWRDADSRTVFARDAQTQAACIAAAVAAGLAAFEAERDEALPARFRALEADRLAALLGEWIAIERERAPFVVAGCEVERHVDIRGVQARVVIDRIDRLDDGRQVIIDYKTGSRVDVAAWAAERIGEPQLPIYATAGGAAGSGEAAGGEGGVAAVAYAHLAGRPPCFAGLAAEGGLLPGVRAIDAAPRAFDRAVFADWQSTLAAWRARLEAVADELRAGEAAVRVARDADVQYADVLPLLRLAERDAQFAAAEPAFAIAEPAFPVAEPAFAVAEPAFALAQPVDGTSPEERS